jgi:allantoate deiminase
MTCPRPVATRSSLPCWHALHRRINGSEPHFLVSGAGHDAMIMAALAPVCMVFIRCHKGISHNPAESVSAQDTEKAFEIMVDFIISFSEKNETEQEF